MLPPKLGALALRTRRPFPIRAVVAALRSLADDLDDVRDGRLIHLAERVQTVRKTVENAEAFWYLVHIVCDRAEFTADDMRALANQYQSVMTTRRQPVRNFTRSSRRVAPPLPTLPMEVKQRPPQREVDGT